MNNIELYSGHFRCCIPHYCPAGDGSPVSDDILVGKEHLINITGGESSGSPKTSADTNLVGNWRMTLFPFLTWPLLTQWRGYGRLYRYGRVWKSPSPHLTSEIETLLGKERVISSSLDTDGCPSPYMASNGMKGRVITSGSSMGPKRRRRHAFLQLGENESICSSLGLYWLKVEVGLQLVPRCLARVGQLKIFRFTGLSISWSFD